MARSASALEARGVHIQTDGSILLDRESMPPLTPLEAERQRTGPIRYQVANLILTATFESPGRICSYEVFNVGPILEPDVWRQTLVVDGQPLTGYPSQTRVHGRRMVETWQAPGFRLAVTSFCDDRRNVLYQAYRLEGLDDSPHRLEASIRAGFLVDKEEGTCGLHFDERAGAIVAILGQMQLEAEPGATGAGRTALFGADLAPLEWRVSDQRSYLTYRLEAPAHRERAFCLVVSAGLDRSETEALFEEATDRWRDAHQEADLYATWLSRRLEVDDLSLRSLFAAGLNAALSAYKEDPAGRFRGLLPGAEDTVQTTGTIPCDAYWTSQALLPFRPEMVRDEILALARAVHDDGRLARIVTTLPRQDVSPGADAGPYDLSPDACDSPSYFAMLVHDYLCWTGDRELLDLRAEGRSIWEKVQACVNYLRSRDTNRDSLFEKRPTQPDWAFDVLRDDWVTYDLALHCQALKSAAKIALLRGEEEAARNWAGWLAGAQSAINQRLWDEGGGHYVDYVRSYRGFVEDHAAIDTVVAALYGIGTEGQSHRHLEYLERTLETRHNDEQHYGDWGVMSCFPPYSERSDLVGRSARAYSFHNGAAWPGWSGVYALAELLHRRPGWRYALKRWWTYGLAHYWFTPTEYYAPPYDAPTVRQGTALYAWSAMPAAAMILGGFGFWPNLAGEVVLRLPPWGDSRLNGVHLRGEVYDVEARAGIVTVLHEGDQVASSPHGMRLRLGQVALER